MTKRENCSNKRPLYRLIKRLFDLFFSFVLLALLIVPLFIVGVVIKLNSSGPAVFKDRRIGKDGKEIKIYKFRSMYSDAEENIDKYLTSEQKEIWNKERKLENDPRITKVGSFIRKTSIDELPQLLNIFIGNLSFVGPRPISKREYETHFSTEEQKKLTSVKPGLTGFWQIYGRNNIEFENGERQKIELSYVDKCGLLTDIKVMFLTVPAVLSKKGVKS